MDVPRRNVICDRAAVDEPRDQQRQPEHRDRDRAGPPGALHGGATTTDHQVGHARCIYRGCPRLRAGGRPQLRAAVTAVAGNAD